MQVMNPSIISDDIPRLLREVLEAVVAPFRSLLAEAGITEQQWRVLRTIADGPKMQLEIARACAIQPASLSGVLARMERAELVDRHRSTVDQRRQDVEITEKGQELMRCLGPQVALGYEQIARSVGAETLAALVESATAMRDAARSE